MDILKNLLKKEEVATKEEPAKKVGKIIKLGDGWGFITSRDIPYTRIFFHWSGLLQTTLHFTELKEGMRVEFIPKDRDQGLLATKIQVLEDEEPKDG